MHNLFCQGTGNKPSMEQVKSFVKDNFDEEGSEFENWEPKDWKDNIAILEKITVRILLNK